MKIEGINSQPEIELINKSLADRYGRMLNDKPKFRVVWSDAQTEKRFGKYAEFYGSIFLREVSGLREVPKYPFIKERWVIEQWHPPEVCYDHQIPETAQGAYEPLWTFQHDDGHAVPVTLDICVEIIYFALNKKLPGDRASDMKAQEKKEFDKEVEHNMEVLADEGSPLKVDGKAII